MEKEYHIRVNESEYMELPKKFRERSIAIFNDYDEHKDDEIFKGLYNRYKKAKKELEKYKFNKRHGL